MTPETIAVVVGGAVLAALGGYLLGVRMGVGVRERLRQSLRHREEELRRSRLELSAVLKAEKSERVRAETKDIVVDTRDVEAVESPEVDQLAAQVREVMGPIAALARMQTALTGLPETFAHRGHLEGLLEEVASRASLTYVVLSDEAGLPLAASRADSPEAVAAAASVVLTLADRLEDSGQPAALGAVVHDAEGRRVLHRIFDAGSERYVLTAVAEGVTFGPDALDPVLPRVRRLLRQPGPVVEVA